MAEMGIGAKVGYGIGLLANKLSGHTFGFFLLFYLTSVAKVDPALAGIMLMTCKICSAIFDLGIGALSDKTQSSFGKRRIYFIASALPLGLSFAMLWHVPEMASAVRDVYYFAVLIFFSLASSAFFVTHAAILPDLSDDSHQRTSIVSIATACGLVGTLLGSGISPLVVRWLGGQDAPKGYMGLGILYGSILFLSALVAFYCTRGRDFRAASTTPFRLTAYFSAMRSRTFSVFLAMTFLSAMAVAGLSANYVYLIHDVLQLKGKMAQIPLGLMLLISIASIPIWVKLLKRHDKRYCLMSGLGLLGAISLVLSYTAQFSQGWFLGLICLAGFAVAPITLCHGAMLPDLVDHDEVENGIRREGIFYGAYSFGHKVAQAVALSLNGFLLKAAGYHAPDVPGAIVAQSDSVVSAIRFMGGPLPLAVFLISLFLTARYPITRSVSAEVRRTLDMRKIRTENVGAAVDDSVRRAV